MFESIFIGGTFENLHKGHQYILKRAYGEGKRVTIGLTSDKYVAEFKKGSYKSFEERKNTLEDWLTRENLAGRTTIIPIQDAYEPAASTTIYQALIVTQDTKERGEEINSRRLSKGLPAITLIELPMIAADDGRPISSTRIRKGEIDQTGHLVMPEDLRNILSRPLGFVYGDQEVKASIERNVGKTIISVGDVTTQVLIKANLVPNLSIIDLCVRRKPAFKLSDFQFGPQIEVVSVKSGPGFISEAALGALSTWSKKQDKTMKTVIVVDGEEDLLVLPVIIYAPFKSIIYYGQPPVPTGSENEGLVELEITDELKSRVQILLDQFLKSS